MNAPTETAALSAEIAALAERVRELDVEARDLLGNPDQADEQDFMKAVMSGKRGVEPMVRLNAVTTELVKIRRQLAEAHARRELAAEAAAKARRQQAREHAAALLPEHRAIAGRLAAALEEMLIAAAAEAELHEGLRRRFDHVPLERLATLDLCALRSVAQKAKAYAGC